MTFVIITLSPAPTQTFCNFGLVSEGGPIRQELVQTRLTRRKLLFRLCSLLLDDKYHPRTVIKLNRTLLNTNSPNILNHPNRKEWLLSTITCRHP